MEWYKQITGKELNPRVLVIAFFCIAFVVGLVAVRGFGVSWDEPNQFGVGQKAYAYVFQGAPWPTETSKRFYGTVFELPAEIIITLSGFQDSRDIVILKHFLTFLTFLLGLWAVYGIGTHYFKSRMWGLAAAVLLFLSPRIFGDAFYNSKDIPNLAFYTLAMYSGVLFLHRRTWKSALLHGLASALATGVRLTSITIPAMTIGLFVLRLVGNPDARHDWKKGLRELGIYIATWLIGTIAVWPFLWEQPVAHFLEAYKFMSTVGIDTYYMGTMIHHLPWHYVFVWIAITMPPLCTIAFVFGLGAVLTRLVKNPVQWILNRQSEALFLGWFFAPILAVYVTGAGIFDGWRHLYFLAPVFILIGLIGVRWVYQLFPSVMLKRCVIGAFVLQSIWLCVWMVRYHPVENAYFSIPAAYVQHNFELDYWGLSFRPGFEYLLAHDPSPVINVWPTSSPGWSTMNVLTPEQRSRLNLTDEANATYVLDNYRLNHYAQDYQGQEISAIWAGGVKVMSIYKIK